MGPGHANLYPLVQLPPNHRRGLLRMPQVALARVEADSRDDEPPLADLSCDSLFTATLEPTVILDVQCGSVIHANWAAARLLGVTRSTLVGMPLPNMLEGADLNGMRAALDNIRESGVAQLDAVRVRGSGAELIVRMSFVAAGNAGYVLAHLSTARNESIVPAQNCSLVYDAVDNGATGMVVTDAALILVYANRAFLRLIAVDSLAEAVGRPLSRWMELCAADIDRMREQMIAREATTVVSLRLKNTRPVGASLQALAIAVPDEEEPMWGFSISERSRVN